MHADPIVATRGLATFVALQGALRAGIVCSPIDPGLPPAAIAALCTRLGGPAACIYIED